MKVLITGGAGNVGKVVARHFIQQGWEARILDRQPAIDIPGAEYVQGDILRFEDARDAARGCDRIAHLAAIPSPMSAPGPEVFANNVVGTFNVFEAAAAEGISRVAHASSINAIGCAYGLVDMNIRSLPLDEDHPPCTTDPYAFAKQTIESVGDYFWRRDGISSVALRLPGVITERSAGLFERMYRSRATMDELAALPDAEWQPLLEDARQRARDFRRQRLMQYPEVTPSFEDEPVLRAYAFHRFNFFAYVDARDAAQAFEKGVTADYEGSHALFVTAQRNWIDYDSATIARLFYPEAERVALSGAESLISSARAQALIGYEPVYSIGDEIHD